jgi:hypothetical protein
VRRNGMEMRDVGVWQRVDVGCDGVLSASGDGATYVGLRRGGFAERGDARKERRRTTCPMLGIRRKCASRNCSNRLGQRLAMGAGQRGMGRDALGRERLVGQESSGGGSEALVRGLGLAPFFQK